MWYGYLISQWVSLGVYMVGIIILFTGVCIASVWINNKLFNKKNKLYISKKKSVKDKQWFYDVA